LFLFGTLLFQTLGLEQTSIAKSGFITTLYSLLIPLILMIFAGKRYQKAFWGLLAMALLGMAYMCNLEMKDLNRGDALTFLCALSAAFHIMYIGKVASEIDSPVEFNFLQNFFVSLFSLTLAFMIKGPIRVNPLLDFHNIALKGVLFLGIVSSMISFSIQVIAQKKIAAHIAGLIFLMESPFAAMFGFIVFRERLNFMNIGGAILIIISVLLVPIFGKEVTALKNN
jgi:drug/metabolite transporter (DMT)-like permease